MRRIALLSCLAVLPSLAFAHDPDLDLQPGAQQSDFKSVARDLAATLDYKALAPAEAEGVTGFGIGVYGAYVPTGHPHAWERLTGAKVDQIGMAGVIVDKGLPFGIDIGATYAAVPGTDTRLIGAEVKYAIIEGDTVTPAVAVRGTYTDMSGVHDVDFRSYGADLSVSKGFGPLTPYGGVGYLWTRTKPDSDFFTLDTVHVDKTRVFAGLRLTALLGITPEYERVGSRNSFNLRFGFAF